jgi:hypothetical protein
VDPQPTSSPAPADELAQLPGPVADHLRARAETAHEGDAGDGPATRKADAQTTTKPPAGQQEDDPVAKLTPEQRARILAEADPDEVAKVNDRFNGYVGKRLQVSQAEAEKAQRQQQLLGLRDKALREKDPDAALAYTEAATTEDLEAQHQAAWSAAVDVFHALDAHPATKPIVAGLAGRDYGTLAGGNGTLAALLYKADLAQNVVEHLPTWEEEIRAEALKDAEKKLRPALEREIRAKLLGEEPPPDTGSGGAPTDATLPRSLPEFRRYIRAMSPAEYSRREAELDRHAASLTGRGAASR